MHNTNSSQQFFPKGIKPRIRLRSPKSSIPTDLYLEVCYLKKRSRVKLYGCKVFPCHWNNQLQRAYISPILDAIDNHNNSIVNTEIESYLKHYKDFIDYLCASNNIDKVVNFHSELNKFRQ